MRITLNLATRPFADLGPALKRLRVGMAVLAALCLLFLLGLHLFDRQAAAARAREHSLDGRIAQIQAERDAAEALMSQPGNAQVLKQAEFLNQLFDEKAFSWTLAMEAMETVLPGGVQVTSIEPTRAKDGHIAVHLHVVGPRDHVVDLVSNLERSRRFLDPSILGENAESTNGPTRNLEPISASNRFDFDLLADYNPPAPEERTLARPAAIAASPAPLGKANPKRPRPAPIAPPESGRGPYTGPAPSSNHPPGFHPAPRTQGGPQ
jgi:type IV pilus assembly protein PilN